MGTSSGGQLALSLAFDTPAPPPLAVLDFYGAVDYRADSWERPVQGMPVSELTPATREQLFAADPVPTRGGVSLEGQAAGCTLPGSDARTAFAMNHLARGRVVDAIYPEGADKNVEALKKVDPVPNVSSEWTPVCIVHGLEDVLVPIERSRALEKRLRDEGVECVFIEVEGEGHTFAGKMVKSSRTWETQPKGVDWLEKVVTRTQANKK